MPTRNERGNGRFSGRPADAGHEPNAGHEPSGDTQTAGATDPAGVPLAKQIAELREYLAHYLSTRADALRVHVRSAAVSALLALTAGFMLLVAVATAVVLLVVGLADGLTEFLGERPWAGKLAAGGVILGLASILMWWGKSNWDRVSTRELREKYARRRKRQRDRLRSDVRQRATEERPRS